MSETVQTFRPDIRLSRQEVEILNVLRKSLQIQERNVLCRLAFCLACQDPTVPPKITLTKAEGVDPINWETFAGEYGEIYSSLSIMHYQRSNLAEKIDKLEYFRRLLYRGLLRLKTKDQRESSKPITP